MTDASKPQTPAPQAPAGDAAKLAEAVDAQDTGIRETLESIVIAFVLAFVFRAFIVEAFVIPTGSMAPTLLGQHVRLSCPQCGYAFTAGPRSIDPETQTARPQQTYLRTKCPMCDYELAHDILPTDAGDRILVLKYLYNFREPERWDVVVFKNPEDPSINYIKRLVGLPNEQVLIAGGDLYRRDYNSENEDDWRILAKPDHVQRAVWQPVYRSNYYPRDGGADGDRWSLPWMPVGATAGQWTHEPTGPRFVFEPHDERPGVLRFTFSGASAKNYYAYNSVTNEGPAGEDHFQDMRIGATVVPRGEGLRLTLVASSFEQVFRAVVESDGRTTLQAAPRPDGGVADIDAIRRWQTLATASRPIPPRQGEARRYELWHVDARLSLFVDGKRVTWNLPDDSSDDHVALSRSPASPHNGDGGREAVVAVSVAGAAATLRDVDLDRDLHYTAGSHRGSLAPVHIRSDDFFCLGDNSPASRDSRAWTTVNPWVAETVGGPRAELVGFVPRKLMIGRAFFVYFPAPHRVKVAGFPFIPNFGDMRFIR